MVGSVKSGVGDFSDEMDVFPSCGDIEISPLGHVVALNYK